MTDIGCLTYTRRSQYLIDITCSDGYGSNHTKTLTFNVLPNSVPKWLNIPNLVTLNTDVINEQDNIFSIMYWDLENENLIYNYTYNPVDYGYFVGSPLGNYNNSLANITMTNRLMNITNETFLVVINAHERRNEIEGHLTICVGGNYDKVTQGGDDVKLIVPAVVSILVALAVMTVVLMNRRCVMAQLDRRNESRKEVSQEIEINVTSYEELNRKSLECASSNEELHQKSLECASSYVNGSDEVLERT